MTRMLAMAFLFFAGLAHAGVKRGDKMPGFTLAALKGGKVASSSWQGKVVLIDFWAEWCEPCRRELPELEKLSRELAAKGVVVVSVNIDKSRDHAEKLVKDAGVTFPVLLDPSGDVAGTFDLPKMPSSYLIDKTGKVRFVHEGYEGVQDIERFRKEIADLLR